MMRKLGQLAALAVAVILLLGMQRTAPTFDQLVAPIPVSGDSGETVEARSFTLRVDTVQYARQLSFGSPGFEKVRDTGGVWAVVTATAAARDATVTIAGVQWEGPTGTLYDQTERLNGVRPMLALESLQPDMPKRGWFIFEVPEDQLRGATLLVSQARYPRLDSQARIGLGRDDGRSLQIRDSLDLTRPPLRLN